MATLEDNLYKPELQPLVIKLNNVLADLFIEFHSLKQRHWHIKGLIFKDIHEFFDDVTDEVLEWIDDIGEYVVSFGAIAITDPLDIIGRTNIVPSKATQRDPLELLENGMEAMQYLKDAFIEIDGFADDVNELGVCNKVQDIITEIDKFIYKYQAYQDMPKQ